MIERIAKGKEVLDTLRVVVLTKKKKVSSLDKLIKNCSEPNTTIFVTMPKVPILSVWIYTQQKFIEEQLYKS